ncbi:hypothetical protein [Leeuwenhoekiella sp. LLG6367-2.1]|uniref:hypothetical protein n=1 Tax=Leeuwenhoekiella sp. LLG6367-2.1 TaxID=3160833 RepID=UPI0038691CCE
MEKTTKKETLPEDIRSKIKDRESWFKIIGGLILLALIAYKVAVSELNFDFSKFEFSDLLSLTLAIFSIGLSVAFYFKATDTSNKFYDNTYKFTKEISEILGRIEAGFGERLKHLDEGYTGLRDKFDGSPNNNNNEEIEEAKKELETEKEQLESEMKQKNELLNELMNKAQLGDTEREEFTERINQREEQIQKLSSELRFLNRRLRNAERSRENDFIHSIDNMMRERLMRFISKDVDINMLLDAPIEFLVRRVKYDPSEHPESLTFPLQKMGFLDGEMKFTETGVELLRSIARRM